MSKQKQKDAVFTAIANVLSEANITVEEGTSVAPLMTSELRAQVNTILFEGFRGGTVELSREYSDAELKAFVSGLQSNWIRKDKRLNGGVAYVAKNPGSRAGSGDEQLKAMRQLLKTLTSETDRAEVESHISARVSEIRSTKTKPVKVDFASLPPELAAKYSSN